MPESYDQSYYCDGMNYGFQENMNYGQSLRQRTFRKLKKGCFKRYGRYSERIRINRESTLGCLLPVPTAGICRSCRRASCCRSAAKRKIRGLERV